MASLSSVVSLVGSRHTEPAAEIEAGSDKPVAQVTRAAVIGALVGRHAGADAEAHIAELAAIADRALDTVVDTCFGVVPTVVVIIGAVRRVGQADLEAAEFRGDVGDLLRVASVQPRMLQL